MRVYDGGRGEETAATEVPRGAEPERPAPVSPRVKRPSSPRIVARQCPRVTVQPSNGVCAAWTSTHNVLDTGRYSI